MVRINGIPEKTSGNSVESTWGIPGFYAEKSGNLQNPVVTTINAGVILPDGGREVGSNYFARCQRIAARMASLCFWVDL